MSCCETIVLKRVEGAGLPDLGFRFDPPVQISATYSSIKAFVRLDTGISIEKDAVIDDDANGVFHFEFDDGEIYAGVHEIELEFVDLATGKTSIEPKSSTIRWDVRARA